MKSSPHTAKMLRARLRLALLLLQLPLHSVADFDCPMREMALSYSTALVPESASVVHEALQLEPSCGVFLPPSPPPPPASPASTDEALVKYVATDGDDANSGESPSLAWLTPQRALAFLASRVRKQPVEVRFAPGVYRLNATLRLGNAHSNASFVAQNASAGATVFSGGVPIEALGPSWSLGHDGVWTASLRTTPWWPFHALSHRGVRQLRARWPNGDPEVYCPRDQHGGNCEGFATLSATKTLANETGMVAVGPTNVRVLSAESGATIATGTMRPFDRNFTYNVTTPGEAWWSRRKTWSDFRAFRGGALDRFDLSLTKAFWKAGVPATAVAGPDLAEAAQRWNLSAGQAIVHMYQTGYWGNWQFVLDGVNQSTMRLAKGGFQESRGGSMGGDGSRGIRQDYFVENVKAELDVPREWYFDAASKELRWIPASANGDDAVDVEQLVAPTLHRLVEVAGESMANPVSGVSFVGVHFRDTLPTFLEPHEQTAGGDWAIHRGAAVVVSNAEEIRFDECSWDAMIEGNGVIFDGYVRNSAVTRSLFTDLGSTPVLLAGIADLMDGTAGTAPIGVEVSFNHMHHFGVWNRQAAGVFESLSCRSNISYNIVHDCPRAAINFNDDFCGGTLAEGNLLFNAVLDTGEHGTVNGWGRQPILYRDETTQRVELVGAPRIVRSNLVVRTSYRGQTSNLWALDKDDGCSRYLEESNVLLYGSVKARDGVERNFTGNLILYPDVGIFPNTSFEGALTAQINGFEWDIFANNTVFLSAGSGGSFLECSTNVTPTYGSPTPGGITLAPRGCAAKGTTFAEWQALGFDEDSVLTDAPAVAADIVALAQRYLTWPRTTNRG